ncbi:MAG: GNAT family N-acetyltransferase [Gammaproteobacteria bacterium]
MRCITAKRAWPFTPRTTCWRIFPRPTWSLRFAQTLDARSRGWKQVRLTTPIRWAEDDPLEAFVFRALLLDAAAAPDEALAGADPADCLVAELDRDLLADDDATLGELFGLLVLAHYRTRPYDLRHLLDGPNLSVWVLRYAGHIAATALVAEEGGFDAATAHGVWAGRTRPHGHLMPETLAAHLGLEAAARLRGARVMRIAVHPAVQRRGMGRYLMKAISAWAQQQELDYLGSSFGATPQLLDFWSSVDCRAVRVSVKRGAASGMHSVLMLHGLSEAGRALVQTARGRFLRYLPQQLADPLRDLEPELVERVMRFDGEAPWPALDRQDWLDLAAFAFGRRSFEACQGPLSVLACRVLGDPGSAAWLDARGRTLLITRVLQGYDWPRAAAAVGLPGRAQVTDVLRGLVREVFERVKEVDAGFAKGMFD